jgi:hypothetical protein
MLGPASWMLADAPRLEDGASVGVTFSGYLIVYVGNFYAKFFHTNTGSTIFVNIFSRRCALACAALQTHV